MFEVEGGGGCVGVGGAVLQRRFARPLANKENNRGVMVKRREGKKRLCFRIYTPWLLTFFFSLNMEVIPSFMRETPQRALPAGKVVEQNTYATFTNMHTI